MEDQNQSKKRAATLIVAYQFALVGIAALLDALIFGLNPIVVALPSDDAAISLAISIALLLVNHAWLMTTTELTRLKFDMFTTPEEWAASGGNRDDTPRHGLDELERRHNTHRNTTENIVYFALLVPAFILVSPPLLAVHVWIIGFGVARLGYTYSYLTGRTGLRGLFMSISLLCMYGMALYPIMGLLN